MEERKRIDMHCFLTRMLIPLYVFVSLSLVISHAKAVEHPRSRQVRSKDHRPIHIVVRPKEIEFYPGDTITIACKARGGNKIEDTPYISFFREMEVGHIPLSSGDPGVLVEPAIATEHHENKVKKLLTLGRAAWYTMEWGDNQFYCKATTMDGNASISHFIVRKKWHDDAFNHHRGRRRRNLLHIRRAKQFNFLDHSQTR